MSVGRDTLLNVDLVAHSFRAATRGWLSSKPALNAIRNVSFQVETGSVVGIVGATGAGKSTLSRLILGKEKPEQGRITFLGRDLEGFGKVQRRRLKPLMRHFSAQSISDLDDRTVAVGHLRSELRTLGVTDVETQQLRIREALRLVEVGRLDAAKMPSELSQCQRQRIAIAKAIISRPRLIVADEPALGQDILVQARLLELLLKLRDELDFTLVVTSPDIMVAGSLCDDLIILEAGEIVEQGPAHRVLNAPQHAHTQRLIELARSAEKTG